MDSYRDDSLALDYFSERVVILGKGNTIGNYYSKVAIVL